VKNVEPLPAGDPRGAFALYTIREAADYLDLSISTLQRWVRPRHGTPLVFSLSQKGYGRSIPFVGLAEAFVIASARARKLSARNVREGVLAIKKDTGLDYALANRMIYTDRVDLGLVHRHGHERARDRQLQWRDAVKQDIESIDFGADDYATRITLPRYGDLDVTVDPHQAGGKPLLRSGMRVRDVIRRIELKKETSAVLAHDFGLTEVEVVDLTDAEAGRRSSKRAT
jgi:uncharacterized protein (DUF433 family)